MLNKNVGIWSMILLISVFSSTNSYAETSPLHQASGKGDVKQVQKLIADGAELNSRDKDNHTPLHLALLGGKLKAAQLLIEQGADVNVHAEPILEFRVVQQDQITFPVVIIKLSSESLEMRVSLGESLGCSLVLDR